MPGPSELVHGDSATLRHQARLGSGPRKWAVGAGAKHRLVFIDCLLPTLIHLRHGPIRDVLACLFGVDRSSITRAIGEVRPLLATRGCTIAARVRLRTLAEVLAVAPAAPRVLRGDPVRGGTSPGLGS